MKEKGLPANTEEMHRQNDSHRSSSSRNSNRRSTCRNHSKTVESKRWSIIPIVE
jgi:hypothetical protein